MKSIMTFFKKSISPKVFMKDNCPIREKITIKNLRMKNSDGASFLSKKLQFLKLLSVNQLGWSYFTMYKKSMFILLIYRPFSLKKVLG